MTLNKIYENIKKHYPVRIDDIINRWLIEI